MGTPRLHGGLLMLGFEIRVDRRQIHDQNARASLAGLEDISAQSRRQNHFYRSVRGSDHLVQVALWSGDSTARSKTANPMAVTPNPAAEWIAGQVTEAFPWNEAPRHLIRDRDAAFGPMYIRRVRAMGIRDHPVAPRSPWQNGHVERLIGSIRRERCF